MTSLDEELNAKRNLSFLLYVMLIIFFMSKKYKYKDKFDNFRYLHFVYSCICFLNQNSQTSHSPMRTHQWSSCTTQQVSQTSLTFTLFPLRCSMTADHCDSFPCYFLLFCVVLVKILLPGRMTNHTLFSSPHTHTDCIRLYMCDLTAPA